MEEVLFPYVQPFLGYSNALFASALVFFLGCALWLRSQSGDSDVFFRLCFFGATWLFLARYFHALNLVMLVAFSAAAIACLLAPALDLRPHFLRAKTPAFFVAAALCMILLLGVTLVCSPRWHLARQ